MKNSTLQNLLTITEVSAAAGVSEQTLRHWVRLGQFPAPIKINPRTIRWTRDSLKAVGVK